MPTCVRIYIYKWEYDIRVKICSSLRVFGLYIFILLERIFIEADGFASSFTYAQTAGNARWLVLCFTIAGLINCSDENSHLSLTK